MDYKRVIKGNGKNINKKNFIWNMIGSTMYAATTVVLLAAVTRVLGDDEGGVFSIAFATGQLMLTIGYYEMRAFQVTDVSNKYTFNDYYTVRIITSIVMVICSIGYVGFQLSGKEKVIIAFILCMYKMMDGLADVFEGMFQKEGRLDVAGKSVAFRTGISSIVFIVSIIYTENLFLSCMLMFISAIITFIIFDISIIKEFTRVKVSLCFNNVKKLLKDCFPFFVASFMSIYILNAVKYAIDANMEDRFQAHFGIIFMPTFTISLFSGFILKPLLTTLAESWKKRDMQQFEKIVAKIMICIAAVTGIAMIVAYFIGIPVLSLIYNSQLSEYRLELVILLMAGGISASNTTFYYALTVMRKTRSIFIGYAITFVIAILGSNYFVASWGIRGGAVFHCILMFILGVTFTVLTFINFIKHRNDIIEGI